jgi:hypothetical protein
MVAACPSRNTPQLSDDLLPAEQKLHKADNLLKTNGILSGFSLPKAENMLKTSQLRETQNKRLGMANGSQGGPDNSIYWRGEISGQKKTNLGTD